MFEKNKIWIKVGVQWGLFMYLIMSIAYPLCTGEFTINRALIGIPIWTAAGFCFGYFMKRSYIKREEAKYDKL